VSIGGVFPLTRTHREALLALQARTLGGEAWTLGMIDEEFDRPGGILLGIGSPLAGFACAWAVLDELHLLLIAVDRVARRQGAGAALHEGVLDACRGRASAGWLEVRADNLGAQAFYAHLDWLPVGRRPRYYADGTDAILMRRSPLHEPAANR
jgi:ribosomal protein S18 acetylase RimI-like enzyme